MTLHMKCPKCGIEMELVKDVIEQDGVTFNAYQCSKCGEKFSNMVQLQEMAEKYRALRHSRPVKFSKWGNSIAVRIPKEFVDEFSITEGKEAFFSTDKDGFRIKLH